MAPPSPEHAASNTLFLPGGNGRATTRGGNRTLPDDLLSQSARRLSTLALLYAFTFFMAAIFPALVFPLDRARFLNDPGYWIPPVASIAVALVVALVGRSPRIPVRTMMALGLVFEVASSYGIAFAEFLDPARLTMHGFVGLSWVAVWVPLFTVVIPTRPWRAALTALAAVSAVPVVIGFAMATHLTSATHSPTEFFFWHVFPYLLVVLMGYVGAQVVYALGTEVTRARELGSYRLIERLGQGGMGEVWRARHRLLARPAAIKLIRPLLTADAAPGAQEDARRRFEREAQVTARLRSPHTVELFDFGVGADGVFYYVMELLDGVDLERLVQRFGPVPAERVIHLLRQVCHSLAEAESYGLVHRDIKPANIFVCRYGADYDFVKVLDFGIVKAGRDTAETGVLFTREHVVRGTPAFIAPEQALGSVEIDGRADIYAAGCVAYWLLTGELVFTGNNPMQVLLQHARTPPTPPSQRVELPIPPALERLVLSCLAKDPAERPQTATDLARGLAGIEVATPWTDERAKDWWTLHLPAQRDDRE